MFLSCFIILSNIPFVSSIYRFLEGDFMPRYEYQTKSGDFKEFLIPGKGRDLEYLHRSIKDFEKKSNKELVIYRTFQKNHFKYWNWYHYYSNEYYQFPYLELK